MERRTKLGIIGCGKISHIYLKNLTTHFSHAVEVAACSDLCIERTRERADEFGIPKICDTDDMMADGEIDIILNTTPPQAHESICLKALAAGKHVFVEKPLALTREGGRRVLDAARERGLLVGCAPDSPISAGQQTARRLIDSGAVGGIVAGSFYCIPPKSPECFHPDPAFFFQKGGGPMLDLGVYYITALVSALGPVLRVAAVTRTSFPERTITHDPSLGKSGQKIKVQVPTHLTGTLEFRCGAVITFITSWDIRGKHSMVDRLEFYGSEGSIRVMDRNAYSAQKVTLHTAGTEDWIQAPTEYRDFGASHRDDDPSSLHARGIGVTEMIYALRDGRQNRINGELAYHVLDIMLAIEESSESGRFVAIESDFERAEPMPVIRGNRFEL